MNIFIVFIIFLFMLHFLKIYKMYNQKKIKKKYFQIEQRHDYNKYNIDVHHEPFNLSDIYEFGTFRSHPFKHCNDLDLNISEIRNGMNILDCGCGMLGPSIYFANNYPKLKIHAITNGDDKYQKDILNKIIKNKLKKRIKPYFDDFHNIDIIFKPNYFDRILFIESIAYSNNIYNLLLKAKKCLKKNGKIYIRTIIIPNTKNHFLNKQYNDLQDKLQFNLYYHQNIIHFLQKAGYQDIKYTSVPLFLSDNNFNLFYYLSLLKLNLLNISNVISFLPIMAATYIATNAE